MKRCWLARYWGLAVQLGNQLDPFLFKRVNECVLLVCASFFDEALRCSDIK